MGGIRKSQMPPFPVQSCQSAHRRTWSDQDESYLWVLVLEQFPFEIECFRRPELLLFFIKRLYIFNDRDLFAVYFLFVLEVCFVSNPLDFLALVCKSIKDFPSALPLQRTNLS